MNKLWYTIMTKSRFSWIQTIILLVVALGFILVMADPIFSVTVHHFFIGARSDVVSIGQLPLPTKVSFNSSACLDTRFMAPGSMPYILLVSFPGSGNTWLRHLIERATGIYTGSILNDKTLFKGGFHGQLLPPRSGRVVVVKTHVLDSSDDMDGLVLLLRNPYDALISDFNRRNTKGNHTGQIPVKQFKSKDWKKFVIQRTSAWRELMNISLQVRAKRIVIYYEDLKENLAGELVRLVRFLGLELSMERINCTLHNSEGDFHRPHRTLPFDPFTKPMVSKTNYAIRNVIKLFVGRNYSYHVLKAYERTIGANG